MYAWLTRVMTAGADVAAEALGGPVEVGRQGRRTVMFTWQQVTVVVGVSGACEGQFIFGMTQVTAINITAVMTGSAYLAFDAMAASALGELCNMIAGHMVAELAAQGLACELSPPAIIRGDNVEITTMAPAYILAYHTQYGTIDTTIALCQTSIAAPHATHTGALAV